MKTGALSGIRVLDATRALAGPLTTMILGDLGADVIKVEMPGVGDETRLWGPPFAGDTGPTFIGFNRNKRSAAIDLHTEEGRETCLALVRTCDVFVENFRPGTMERFRLGYDAMRQVRPNIIYCSISGFGQTGPMSHRPALDLMIQAVSGLMSLTGEQDGRPMKAAAPVADVMGGFSAAIAIMGALMERQRTGQGKYLDISMLDGLIALMGQAVAIVGMSGKAPQRSGNGHPLASPYESFRCADRDLVVAVTNEKSWSGFCRLPEFAHLERDPRYASQPLRSASRGSLLPEVNRVFSSKPAAYWLAAFEKVGIPAEPINTLDEIMAHPQLALREMLIECEYPPGSGNVVRTAGMPWRGVAADGAVRPPPALGQHTAEVFAEARAPAALRAEDVSAEPNDGR
jgi:crotonobetainyl-CoA:carnitine CoA-transferase CaiB-like acyl-CoA transferase